MIRIVALLLSLLLFGDAWAQDRFITLSSTTSTQDSGLFGHILPRFRAERGIDVHVVAVGTGQALAIGERGDADALLVHDRAGEDKFVADSYGIDRRDVMYNDFVIVGPRSDPAGVRGLKNAREALTRIAAAAAVFASRGDDSGTNRMELRLWKAAGITPGKGWYRDLGQGMGPTLNIAAGLDAYTLTDRATWANFKNRQSLEILADGDPALFNPYGSILVNPAKWPRVKAADARVWHDWLTSKAGLDAITSYRIAGEQLFFPPKP
jgi:tungstate transport system substrate-binding protein